jgi:hypothetical protein
VGGHLAEPDVDVLAGGAVDLAREVALVASLDGARVAT